MSDIIFRRHKKHISSFDLTPLLDIIFILLVFLMISSVIARDSISLNLPEANIVDEVEKKDVIIVSILKDHRIFVNEKQCKIKDLKIMFSGLDKKVVLRADEQVDYAMFMKVIDQIRLLGIEDISLEHE